MVMLHALVSIPTEFKIFEKHPNPGVCNKKKLWSKLWRHDTQHNNIFHNDTQHYNTQHNDIFHNDTQHNVTQHYGTQHYDTQHKDIQHNK
jgi:hypothetical protein